MGRLIKIDKSIKELSKWREDLNYDNGDDTTRHSLDVAINTMRKYQKIEQIVNAWDDDENAMILAHKIKEVIEDGEV